MRPVNGRAALEAADLVVWEAVVASAAVAQGPQSGLARLMREGAAAALTGVGAACREARRDRGLAALAGVAAELRRLATWLDLAERFGDLEPDRTLAALEAQGRALAAVEALAAAWRADGGGAAATRDGAPGGGEAEPAFEGVWAAGGTGGEAGGDATVALRPTAAVEAGPNGRPAGAPAVPRGRPGPESGAGV